MSKLFKDALDDAKKLRGEEVQKLRGQGDKKLRS